MNETPDSISLHTILRTNPKLVFSLEDDDCAILFDPDSDEAHAMNGSAAAVWRLLDGSRNVSDVVAALRQEYTAMEDTTETEVLELARELLRKGVVSAVEPTRG